jgi:amino acid transporter
MDNATNLDAGESRPLVRELGVWQATSLNVANMIGIGPFITIPTFLAAMGGPQALVGWIVAGILVGCDGLVWSELGAALPGSGGSYHFLREIFGRYRFGRWMPFLFIWQFLISGTLELASGYIGGVDYACYALNGLAPALDRWATAVQEFARGWSPEFADHLVLWNIPNRAGFIAAPVALLVGLALCRPIKYLGQISLVLVAGAMVTVAIVIVSGLIHFDSTLIAFPENAWTLNSKFLIGLGGAMRYAVYDYFGYYNICHLGDEVREPERTIPRAVLWSVALVAAIYLTMNISIIGVVPWREVIDSKNVASLFMERIYGRSIAVAFSWLVVWTALACVFAMTLGYSRVPYAAARHGYFFRAFASIHPTKQYPGISLLAISVLTALFTFCSLDAVMTAAVTVRIAVQFIGQIVGLHWLRSTRHGVAMPFRMWFYPLPSLIAGAGWCFILFTADQEYLWISAAVLVSGMACYAVWEKQRGGRPA